MSSNKSIAVWCSPETNQFGIKFDVHFNYWRMPDKVKGRLGTNVNNVRIGNDFAEIGVMVEDASTVNKLFIYIPVKKQDIVVKDCSEFFTAKNVVQGIFNEQLSIQPRQSGPLVLQRSNGSIFCRMHSFAKSTGIVDGISPSELTISDFDAGTLCTVGTRALAACRASIGPSRAYFRLRIAMPNSKDGNPFVENVPVYDRALLSGYDQIEYLDFRLNEARTLPTAVERRMTTDQPINSTEINLVAFLTAVPVSAELSVANSEFHKMRLLEYSVWSTYAPGLPKGMVVYHWKRVAEVKKPITDFSAFVKLQMRQSGRSTLFRYLAFAFVFGVLGNLTAGLLQDPVNNWLKTAWEGLCALAVLLGAGIKSTLKIA